jgi:hypothetical protein
MVNGSASLSVVFRRYNSGVQKTGLNMALSADPCGALTVLHETDAIRTVLAEYCFAVDERRYADMAALFSEAGTWQTAFGDATGRGAIEQLMRKLMLPLGQGPRAIHSTTNTIIKLDGDRAQAVSN